jgi:branched-chain amino acid aminotransferase
VTAGTPGGLVVWLNGQLLGEFEARISPFDHGLLTGDGIFETLRVYPSPDGLGVAFAATRHLGRLARSAAGLDLRLPDPPVLRRAMEEVIEANHLSDGRLRITVTGGPAPLGSDRADVEPTILVAGSPMAPWPQAADVVTVPWPRNERGALAGLKTISYAENVVALARARQCGAGEAIFGNLAGNLCEGTGTNVFLGIGGRLVTPPLSAGCLAGVTRDLLVELLPVAEEDVPLGRLAQADEAFLTSSTREIQPIRGVDGRVLPAAPGPLTKQAQAAFRGLLASTLDP